MNNKATTGIIVAVVVVLGIGAVVIKNKSKTSKDSMPDHSTTAPASSQSSNSSSAVQETNQITYKGFAVVQKHIKVKKGTTVTWTTEDSAKHDVTPDTETAEFKATELFGKGETKSITFNTAGTYTYHCSPHPYMKGTVEVTE